MANRGFAKDITTPIDIPQVQAPDFSRSQSTTQDVVGILGFGLQIAEKLEAEKAETRRQEIAGRAIKIADNAFERIAQGQSTEKSLIQAKRDISSLGITGMEAMQVNQLVAKSLGFASIGEGVMSEQEKRRQGLEREADELRDFLPIVQDPTRSQESLSDDELEVLVIKAQAERNKSIALQDQVEAAEDLIRQGKLAGALKFFEADKQQYDQVGKTLLSVFQNQMTAAQNAGITELAPFLQEAKESMVSILSNMKRNVQNSVSAEAVLKIDNKEDRARVNQGLEERVKFYDDTIRFVNELEEDKFKDFADLSALMQSERDVNLQKTIPQLLNIKDVFGTQAMNTVVLEAMAKNPQFRRALSQATIEGFDRLGASPDDAVTMNIGIIAGIGKGKGITEYDEDAQNGVADMYWRTTKEFIGNTEAMSLGSKEDKEKVAFASMQVLEFAEERGTEEDKVRAVQTLNSPQFRQLYESVGPELQSAMGRMILQYNRDAIGNQAQKLIRGEDKSLTETKYSAVTGQFEVTAKKKEEDFLSRVGRAGEAVITGGEERLQQREATAVKAQQKKVDELNKQLSVIEVYAKDDPVLSKMTPKERRDFFIINAGLRKDEVRGPLAEFSREQETAQAQGVTVEELKAQTDIVQSTKDVEALLEDVEVALNVEGAGPEVAAKAQELFGKFFEKRGDVDTSDMDDDEFEEFIKQMRAERGKSN